MYLKFPFMASGSHGENIQNQLHTINDFYTKGCFKIGILARR